MKTLKHDRKVSNACCALVIVWALFGLVGFSWATSPACTVPLVQNMRATVASSTDPPTFLAGDVLFLSGEVCGAQPLRLQWSHNGVPVEDATNSFLTIGDLPVSASGFWQLVASNSFGSSTGAVREVIVEPMWYWGPEHEEYEPEVPVGSYFEFAFQVFAYAPVSFQWRHNGMILAGETNRSFIHTNLAFTDSGNYDAILSNRYGSLTSRVVRVEVVAVEIDSLTFYPFYGPQPEGTDVMFQVGAYGKEPLTYQWHFKGIALAAETSDTLLLSNVTMQSAGSYFVVVSNPIGTNRSGEIELMVILPPRLAIRRIADAVELTVTGGLGARRVQCSTDFSEWPTVYSDNDGPSARQVTRPIDQPRQFYRVVSP